MPSSVVCWTAIGRARTRTGSTATWSGDCGIGETFSPFRPWGKLPLQLLKYPKNQASRNLKYPKNQASRNLKYPKHHQWPPHPRTAYLIGKIWNWILPRSRP